MRYLSPEWLEEFDRACREDVNMRLATAGAALVVQQHVADGPDGDVAFHVDFDHGCVAVSTGIAPKPTVTLDQDYGSAAAVARGELSAQGAFMAGRIRVRGDLSRLIAHHGAIAGIGDVARMLRDRTEY